MRLTRGDVVMHGGEFALVWADSTFFPMIDATAEQYAPLDIVMQRWQEMYRISGFQAIAIRITAPRLEPIDGLRVPDLTMTAEDLTHIQAALAAAACCGEPILAS